MEARRDGVSEVSMRRFQSAGVPVADHQPRTLFGYDGTQIVERERRASERAR